MSDTETPATEMVVKIQTGLIALSKDNTRRPAKKNDPEWQGFVQNIKQMGILQPITVRQVFPGREKFELIFGERRLRAAIEAGLETVPCQIVEAEDALAHKMRTVENLQRKDLTPIEEAEQINRLITRSKASLDDIAAEIGRPRQWVARRASLNKLTKDWKKALRTGEITWPATWLEAIARMPVEAQAWLLTEYTETTDEPPRTLQDIQQDIARFIHLLEYAPWPLDYGEPACTKCPKRSGATPDLFDTLTEVAEGKIKSDDRCLDCDCWEAKHAAWTTEVYNNAVKKHGKILFFTSQYYRDTHDDTGYPWKKATILSRSEFGAQYTEAKAGAKDAIPAMYTDGHRRGELFWVRKGKAGKPGKTKGKAAGDEPKQRKPLKERKANLNKLRSRIVTGQVRCHLAAAAGIDPKKRDKLATFKDRFKRAEDFERPPADVQPVAVDDMDALAVIAVFGTLHRNDSSNDNIYVGGQHNFKHLKEMLENKDAAAIVDTLREQAIEMLVYRLGNYYDQPPADEVAFYAERFGIDLAGARKTAEQRKPTPKTWAREEATEKAARKAKAKK